MNKKYVFVTSALMAVLLISGFALAYQENPGSKGPNYSPERHEAMKEAFESGDYDAWVSLMQEARRGKRVLEVITEENFPKFVELREARQSGDIETVKELAEELGLGQGKFAQNHKNGMQRGMRNNGNCPCAA